MSTCRRRVRWGQHRKGGAHDGLCRVRERFARYITVALVSYCNALPYLLSRQQLAREKAIQMLGTTEEDIDEHVSMALGFVLCALQNVAYHNAIWC